MEKEPPDPPPDPTLPLGGAGAAAAPPSPTLHPSIPAPDPRPAQPDLSSHGVEEVDPSLLGVLAAAGSGDTSTALQLPPLAAGASSPRPASQGNAAAAALALCSCGPACLDTPTVAGRPREPLCPAAAGSPSQGAVPDGTGGDPVLVEGAELPTPPAPDSVVSVARPSARAALADVAAAAAAQPASCSGPPGTPSPPAIGGGATVAAPAPPSPPPASGFSSTGPESQALHGSGTQLLEVDGAVEDICDDGEVCGDEHEAARSGSRFPSSLSPHAPAFFPALRSSGRGKFQRWEGDLDACSSDDEPAPAASRTSYLDAARRALRGSSPPPAQSPCGAQGAVEGAPRQAPAGRRRRRRRRRSAPVGATAPSWPATRVPARHRLGPQPAPRIRAPLRLGPRDMSRQPNVDADGFQAVVRRCRRRRSRPADAPPRRRRPVPPELVGLCFNCLAHDHVAAQCHSPSCCFQCGAVGHRARTCRHAQQPIHVGESAAPSASTAQVPVEDAPSSLAPHTPVVGVSRARRRRRRRRRIPSSTASLDVCSAAVDPLVLLVGGGGGEPLPWVDPMIVELAASFAVRPAASLEDEAMHMGAPPPTSTPGPVDDWWASLVETELAVPLAAVVSDAALGNLPASPPGAQERSEPALQSEVGVDLPDVDAGGTDARGDEDGCTAHSSISMIAPSVDEFLAAFTKPLEPSILSTPVLRKTRPRQDASVLPKRSARLAAKSGARHLKPEDQARRVLLKKMGIEVEAEHEDAVSFEELQSALTGPDAEANLEAMEVFLLRGKKRRVGAAGLA